MSNHRRFTDGAGFTRHCWECEHAKGWQCFDVLGQGVNIARCKLTGVMVGKHDSPDNQCCHLPPACSYDDGRAGE